MAEGSASILMSQDFDQYEGASRNWRAKEEPESDFPRRLGSVGSERRQSIRSSGHCLRGTSRRSDEHSRGLTTNAVSPCRPDKLSSNPLGPAEEQPACAAFYHWGRWTVLGSNQ